MQRRGFLEFVCALPWAKTCIALPGAGQSGSAAGTRQIGESKSRIAKALKAALTLERRDWEQGILAQALLEAGDREGLIQLTRAAMVQQTPDGRMGVVVSGGPTDPAMGGVAYRQAAISTGNPEMKAAVDRMLEWIRHSAPRSREGILFHVFAAEEVWSDGFNGAPPFLAAEGLFDEALHQVEGFRKRLWNPEKKLLAHIWDEKSQKLKDPSFWGGGNGWAAAGLARVAESLPADRREDRSRLAEFVRDILDGCLRYQRPDGLFHDVVDEPGTFVETNLAQMLAYAAYTGLAAGWLPAEYAMAADRMRAGARQKMDEDGFIVGACGAPDFNRPGISTEAQAFHILMETAGLRFAARR